MSANFPSVSAPSTRNDIRLPMYARVFSAETERLASREGLLFRSFIRYSFQPGHCCVPTIGAIALASLELRQPTIDNHFRSGHEGRVFARQKQRGLGDLTGFAEATKWYPGLHICRRLREFP